MRAAYSEYVGHCMRFYARFDSRGVGDTRKPQTLIERANWVACDKALKSFPEREQKILLEIYRRKGEMPSCVNLAANTHGFTREATWKLVAALEKRVAQERGLV